MENKTIYISDFKSPFGELILGEFENQICICDWKYRKKRSKIDKRIKSILKASFKTEETDLLKKAKEQLTEYFEQKRQVFDLPILFAGSEFQRSVWEELVKIPFGKTDSYLGLAKKLGNEKAVRPVASANGANSISIIVPCHRIIGSDGELVGYAGGLLVKMKLLKLEGAVEDAQMSIF